MNMIAEIESFGLPEEQSQRFAIDTKDQAIWAMKKIAQAKASQNENMEAAQAEIDRVKDWLKKENESIDSTIFFF